MKETPESVQKIIKAFRTVSRLDCGVVDDTDEYYSRFCRLCADAQRSGGRQPACAGKMTFACGQSERWGGKYEWMCPVGLAFISTVVPDGAGKKTGICAGPFIMTEPDEFMDEMNAFFGGKPADELAIQAHVLPYIECGRVSAFADVLYMLTAYAAERDSIELRILEQVAGNASEQFSSITQLKDGGVYRYPLEAEKELQAYIIQGDRQSAQRVLNDILGNVFFGSGGDFEVIKARTTELIVLLSRAAIEGGADITEIFGLNDDFLKAVNACESPDELNVWLTNVLIRFTNSVFQAEGTRHSGIILKIMAYIRQNYMRKITLNDISENVNFSVSYISRVFKEEMRMSITAFINKVRVDNVKKMLIAGDIPLVEVAYLCGFEDQTYFNKVFKKATGVSPGRFREKRGII